MLESPNSKRNRPLFTRCTKVSIEGSGDSGISPFSQVNPRLTSGLTSFSRSRLNILKVTDSLSVSEDKVWEFQISPLVI